MMSWNKLFNYFDVWYSCGCRYNVNGLQDMIVCQIRKSQARSTKNHNEMIENYPTEQLLKIGTSNNQTKLFFNVLI